ncbi:MAG: ATP-binding cassette domain-containing protein [Bryobacteraceae bacterium]
MPFLSFRDVECQRSGRVVLDRLSFDLDEGETLVLLGRSGSGKTSAIQVIVRLLEFQRGEIEFEGRDLRSLDVIALRRRIGYVIQEIGLLPHWTVAQNVALVPKLLEWNSERIEARVRELLDQVQLPYGQYAGRMPHQLSGGQRQRVGVARALAANPALLLFDEPFGALDPLTRLDMQQQFLALRERYSIPAIFVTHDVTEALKLGTRIAVLDGGRLETIAERRQFLHTNTPVARAFLETLPSRQGVN